MNEQQPVTQSQLTEALAELETRLTAAVREMLQATEQRLQAYARQTAEDAETRIIRAIHGYTERLDQRFRRLESAEASNAARITMVEADARWAALELRVLELEKRLPPTSAQHRNPVWRRADDRTTTYRWTIPVLCH